ncbi:hypothetical protein EON67_12310 [archaeon]|nr:MAG: hypothetical protein EON67_12310 [archaeon]
MQRRLPRACCFAPALRCTAHIGSTLLATLYSVVTALETSAFPLSLRASFLRVTSRHHSHPSSLPAIQ